MRLAHCSSAEVIVNGINRGIVFQDGGFPLDSLRGIKFDNARILIATANINASLYDNTPISLELLGWLNEICEDQIAATTLQGWHRKKWTGKTIPLSICIDHINQAQKKVFMINLDMTRKVEAKSAYPEVRRLLDRLEIPEPTELAHDASGSKSACKMGI